MAAWLADILQGSDEKALLVLVGSLAEAHQIRAGLDFYLPKSFPVTVEIFPSWDCAPYDRSSPGDGLQATRAGLMFAWANALGNPSAGRRLVLMPMNAYVHLLPDPAHYQALEGLSLTKGTKIDPMTLCRKLVGLGFVAADPVQKPGEFAHRGGLIDLFVANHDKPVRLDFFGDEIEELTFFDALSQRRVKQACAGVEVAPVREVILSDEAIESFRQGYRALFGLDTHDDPLFMTVSAGQGYRGMEHWQALFTDKMVLADAYLDEPLVVLARGAVQSACQKLDEVASYYAPRQGHLAESDQQTKWQERIARLATAYKPLPPERLYPDQACVQTRLQDSRLIVLDDQAPEWFSDLPEPLGTRLERPPDFTSIRAVSGIAGVMDALKQQVEEWRGRVKVIAAPERSPQLREALERAGFKVREAHHRSEAKRHAPEIVYLHDGNALGGVVTDDLVVLDEGALLGVERAPQAVRAKKSRQMMLDLTMMSQGDLVVHIEHGIGRYLGLRTIEADQSRHECLMLEYDEGGTLYLPVENIELISLYGEADAASRQLDRLGAGGWQNRKARVRKRIREIAGKLIALAARRKAVAMTPPEFDWQVYQAFADRCPFTLTEDQKRAIDDLTEDLRQSFPMDRLICGDVGFGKTEIAMHAIFLVAYSGAQVAVLAPTTLLAMQHYRTLRQRLDGFGLNIALRSRANSPRQAAEIQTQTAEGLIDVIVGTHALLSKKQKFANLQLLVVDEEQRFGVGQKEQLKELRSQLHILSLSATPIPRTLHMALSGVRELSIIATPPVDRLAIHTILEPFDSISIQRALLREKDRNGQSYVVTPRVRFIPELEILLAKIVPDLTVAVVHGRMPQEALDAAMMRFARGEADLLLATSIIESGIDISKANTMIVHRPDLFGLAQLYQIRGRIGRSTVRAYCYLCLPHRGEIRDNALRRLELLKTLDNLGAGFTLAHHDMDLRGAGNLVGEEQSGHIDEVGIELYQRMLQEAIEALNNDAEPIASAAEAMRNIQINLGVAVGLPERYVADLPTRLSLYRRIARLEDDDAISGMASELQDRFGVLPEETRNLLSVIGIKAQARSLNVEKIDAGSGGIAVKFFDDDFQAGDRLVELMIAQPEKYKMTKDHRLILVYAEAGNPETRAGHTRTLLETLHRMIEST